MEKAEARRKLKGLQLLVHGRGDKEVAVVFDEVLEYIEREKIDSPTKTRKKKGGYDRQESGGLDREET